MTYHENQRLAARAALKNARRTRRALWKGWSINRRAWEIPASLDRIDAIIAEMLEIIDALECED